MVCTEIQMVVNNLSGQIENSLNLYISKVLTNDKISHAHKLETDENKTWYSTSQVHYL